ncbi:hypothetical protein C0992_002282 [Termitomyces sp. T32_za158]|nr:hypothetical protein C0992_002282 [Termitomyces sp. T32_za158]
MLARLPVLLLCLAASVAALSMHHVHRGVAHRAVAHRAVQPTLRRRADGKRCKVRASSIASSLSSIHKTAVVHEVSTSVPSQVTTKAEPTSSKVEPTTPKLESTTPQLQPTTPKAAPTTPKAEPTSSKVEPTTPKAEPTSSKAGPTTPKAEPTTSKAEPTTPKAEPTTPKAEPTTPKAEPTTPKAEPTTTQAPAPAPAPTKAPVNAPSFLVGTQTGQGTFYSTGLGACGIVNKDTDFIAAVSHSLFDAFPGYNGVNPNTNPMCGKRVAVSYEGKSITVALTDRCTGCALTDLDFSPSAFAQLAPFSVGRLNGITWHWLD